jgi:hypothetical protein
MAEGRTNDESVMNRRQIIWNVAILPKSAMLGRSLAAKA